MKLLDLFSGTRSISDVFQDAGHEVFTIDFDDQFDTDWNVDILKVSAADIIEKFGRPDVIWASPPCQTFSIASCMHHWQQLDDPDDGDEYTSDYFSRMPKSERCEIGVAILEKTLELISELQPKFWFMENPRGMMRKHPLTRDLNRTTVTYCRYGDTRMKPTDIWGVWPESHEWRPMCKNGMPCHQAAPRGSATGTQGLGNAVERSRVPFELCDEVRQSCERDI